jgi:hypothetical protein
MAGPTYEPVPYGAKLDCDRLPTSLRIANNIVSPVPVRGVTQWVTAPSDLYPHPQTRTALTLYGGQNTLTSNDQGAATLTDSVLGSASGTFVIRGNSIGFTSATLCGMGDLHGDMQSGLNVSTFQLWPMLCRAGVRFCSCNSGSIVQAKDLTIQETLVQCGGDAPSVRPPDQPYRQRSDLSGQTWAFFYQGRTVSLSFERSGRVLFSDPAWGSVAAWSSVGPEAIRIDANGEVFIGTLSLDGTAIDAKVYRGNNTQVQDQLTLKKVSATGP